MKRTILLCLAISMSVLLKAQQINLEFGKLFSRFDYTNSTGQKLENIQTWTDNHLAIRFNLPIRRTDFYFTSGLALNKYGAQCSDEIQGNYYEWKANYLSINVGCGYEFLKTNSMLNFKNTNTESGFTFFLQFNTGTEFLLQGTQTINEQVYSLKGVEQFNKPLIFIQGGIGVRYYATKTIAIFAQYTGGKSFSVFKSGSGDDEKLNIIAHSISLGISVNLPANK